MNEFATRFSLGLQVEAGIERNHEEAVEAWKLGRLPTADPPASPVFVIEGSGS